MRQEGLLIMRTFAHLLRVASFLTVVVGLALVGRGGPGAEAHHYHHGHAGFLLPGLESYELNNRTTTVQSIRIVALGGTAQQWQDALSSAVYRWNAGMQVTAGFAVYMLTSGDITMQVSTSVEACPPFQKQPWIPAHGCVLDWNRNAPSARIYMQDFPGIFDGDSDHEISDVMHEMGHVLYYAGEHYNNPNWNCIS